MNLISNLLIEKSRSYKNFSNLTLSVFLLLGIACQSLKAATKVGETIFSNSDHCYSSYHLNQNLDIKINFNKMVERKNIVMDMDIHIKETIPSNSYIANQFPYIKNIRSFVFLANQNTITTNGNKGEASKKYQHPFLVYVNGETNELLDLRTSTEDQAIINEYYSFFDLFQYSTSEGLYEYRNGNGAYKAAINKIGSTPIKLEKINRGYIQDHNLYIKNSLMSIVENEISSNGLYANCFYKRASGVESFRKEISKGAYINGNTEIKIVSDHSRALPNSHYFYDLTNDLSTWPNVSDKFKLSREEALDVLPELMISLESVIDNKSKFLDVMKKNEGSWEYLAKFMSNSNIDNSLSNTIIWSLDRIDSTASVSALLNMASSELSNKQKYRAVLALVSTVASANPESIGLLKSHLEQMRYSDFNSSESLLLVKSLGIFSKRRASVLPDQSKEIKEFLYTQFEGSNPQYQSAILESIGALGATIDEEGIIILMNSLESETSDIVQASLVALEKIPYDQQYSDQYVSQLKSETNRKIKHRLIELLANTSNTDNQVKEQLISLAGNSRNINDRKLSLNSLKKIGYEFQSEDLKILESQLRVESDKTNQKLLASLILKARRNKKHL